MTRRSKHTFGAAVALAAAVAFSFTACSGGGGGGSGRGAAGGAGASAGTGAGAGTNPGTSQPSALARFETLVATLGGMSAADQRAAMSAFVDAQAKTLEGFPLRDGLDAIFVYRGASARPLAVAGAWNGWSTSALPMQRAGVTDVWWAKARLPRAARWEYKIVEAGSRWLGDPLNRKFTYGFQNAVLNLAGSGESHLERHRAVRASRLGNTRDVIVYLPAGALDGQERYPVVYMHDGQNLFDPDAFYGGWGVDATCDALIAAGAIKKVIVVGVANTPGRFDEYTHVPDDISSRCSGPAVGGRAADYAHFIVSELKPAIDALYPTLPGRDDTAVLGSSLGGLVSLWMGLEYPHVFKNVGGMSSTLGWGSFCLGNPRLIDIARAKGKLDIRVYIDSGGDGPSRPGGDNWDVTEELKLLLESQGYTHGVDLFHWWERGAGHNEAEWRARVEMPLRFWFKR